MQDLNCYDENIDNPDDYIESESPEDTQIDDDYIIDDYEDDYDYNWPKEEDIIEKNIADDQKLLRFVAEGASLNIVYDKINELIKQALLKYPDWIFIKNPKPNETEYNETTKTYKVSEWWTFMKIKI